MYELGTYTLTFGTLERHLHHLGNPLHFGFKLREIYPFASSVLLNDFFANDVLIGGNSISEIQLWQKQLASLEQSKVSIHELMSKQ